VITNEMDTPYTRLLCWGTMASNSVSEISVIHRTAVVALGMDEELHLLRDFSLLSTIETLHDIAPY